MAMKAQKKIRPPDPGAARNALWDAIHDAPLGELRKLIWDEVQGDPFHLLNLRLGEAGEYGQKVLGDAEISIQACMLRATLGDQHAMEGLLNIGLSIATFARQLFSTSKEPELFLADRLGAAKTNKGTVEPGRRVAPWRQRIRKSVAKFEKCELKFLEKTLEDLEPKKARKPKTNSGPQQLVYFSEASFDYAPHTIWLPPKGENDGPDEPLSEQKRALIHGICTVLIRRRFIDARPTLIGELASRATGWPVPITLLDFQKGYLARKANCPPGYLPPTKLGSAIRLNLKNYQGVAGSPAHDAAAMYWVLDEERTEPHTPPEVDDVDDGNENKRKHLRGRLKKSLDKAEQIYGRPESTRSKADRKVLSECVRDLEAIWKGQAALLPPLARENVKLWARAAFARVASWRQGDLGNYVWPEAMQARILRRGSATGAGIMEYYREGFISLAPTEQE